MIGRWIPTLGAAIMVVIVAAARPASAQDAALMPPPSEPVPAPAPAVAPPLQWTEWEVVGTFVDPPATVRAILDPEVRRRAALTDSFRTELAEVCASIGYQLLDVRSTRLPTGIRATLEVAPIQLVRWVDVTTSRSRAFLDDDIRRRLRLRPGAALPYEAAARQRLLDEEVFRTLAYLRDEGYLEARVAVKVIPLGKASATVRVDVELGPAYRIGKLTVENLSQAGGPLAIPVEDIAPAFHHSDWCLAFRFPPRCERVVRAQLTADLEQLTRRFQRRGYPAVRVTTDYDPQTSLDRKTKTVDLTIKIDQRRRLEVVFEGNDTLLFPDEELEQTLTFATATTVDDFEIEASTKALERHYQERGYFDVMISHERVRFRGFDRVVFRIEAGPQRALRTVEMACRSGATPRPCSIDGGDLRDAVGTQTSAASTTEQLAADVASLERLYKRRGFPRAKVTAAVAPTTFGWPAAALAAAELALARNPRELRVRFTIDEGPRTTLTQINVVFEGAATGDATAADERQVRARLGFKVGDPYVRDTVDAAAKAIEDWYWSLGRPRAQVTIPDPILSADGRAAIVTINIEERQQLRVGEVIVRGNFRTRDWVIRKELGFDRDTPLTGELYRGGAARLRATSLFSAVSLTLLGFDEDRRDTVDVVVRVEERKDVFAQTEVEFGYSQQNSVYVRGNGTLPNVGGMGIRGEANITVGKKYTAVEPSIRFPHWLSPTWAHVDSEVAAYWRLQSTERFGDLTTFGGTLSAVRSWSREATEHHQARLVSLTGRYDLRARSRVEDLVRVSGPASDLTTNPIRTRTGTIGVTVSWDQRRDTRGNLNPLAPDHGFRAELSVSGACTCFLGQDNFLKVSGLGQTFFTKGRVQLRLEGRYDQGIPLGGAVLLPEVERFFAGGDVTVRGFEEDRLATELITASVPPLGQTTQIRVLPAGGNVRALSTADLQVALWSIGGLPVASAAFVDAGVVTNTPAAVRVNDIRPAAGTALRLLTPFGAVSAEYAIPLVPRLGDDPRGRVHVSVALRY